MNSNDRKVTFIGIGILFVMLVLSMVLGSNTTGDDESDVDGFRDPFVGHTIKSERISFSGDLDEGATAAHDIDNNGKIIKNITATLVWEDESDLPGRPRIRQYNNQPDSFSVAVSDGSGNFSESASGTNPEGQQGMAEAIISLNGTIMKDMMDQEMSWSVEVTMVEAGMWSPRIGVIGFTDPGNAYDLIVKIDYYDLSEFEEE